MMAYKNINYKMPSTVYKEKAYNEKEGAYASQIAQMQRYLNEQLANKPGAYQSQYQNQINNTVDAIGNRKPFVYDLNADALYNQYRNQYVNLGKQAMADTIGQASALTGGYGNSYAATVGNQAYQNYLGQLNNIVPELHNNAYGRYKDEEQSLYNKLAMYQNQDALDYGKYQDAYANWQNDRNYYSGELSTLRGMNQDLWAQNESNRYNANSLDWNNYYTAENFNFENYRQAVAEQQFNAELAEKQRQFNASKSKESDDSVTKVEVDTIMSQPSVKQFKATILTKDEFRKRTVNGPYAGFDTYEEYVDDKLDDFKDVNGYKFSNSQKAAIIKSLS